MKIKVGIKNEFNSLHRKINNCLDIFKEKISDQTHSKKKLFYINKYQRQFYLLVLKIKTTLTDLNMYK